MISKKVTGSGRQKKEEKEEVDEHKNKKSEE